MLNIKEIFNKKLTQASHLFVQPLISRGFPYVWKWNVTFLLGQYTQKKKSNQNKTDFKSLNVVTNIFCLHWTAVLIFHAWNFGIHSYVIPIFYDSDVLWNTRSLSANVFVQKYGPAAWWTGLHFALENRKWFIWEVSSNISADSVFCCFLKKSWQLNQGTHIFRPTHRCEAQSNNQDNQSLHCEPWKKKCTM